MLGGSAPRPDAAGGACGKKGIVVSSGYVPFRDARQGLEKVREGGSALFGRKSRAERLKEEARAAASPVSLAALAGLYEGARPVAERLLNDDDLRDNIRAFINAAQTIYDEVSGEDPSDIVTKLWGDDKLRKQVETAAGAAQEGAKRVRGERVAESGGGPRPLLLLAGAGALGFLFLSPQTGPQARKIAQEIYSTIRS